MTKKGKKKANQIEQGRASAAAKGETQDRAGQRITMLYALQFLLAELGEHEYWNSIWGLIRRPGRMIADYLNGKRERYLQPFQVLLGTLILFGIVLYIVPAKVSSYQPREEMVDEMIQAAGDLPPAQMERAESFRRAVHLMDAYALWQEEHVTTGFQLLARSFSLIFFTWLLFRRSPREDCPYPLETNKKHPVTYNFAEMLTVYLFIISQLQLVSTLWTLVVGWFVPTLDFSPYVFPSIIMVIVLFIDYQQLFHRKWYSTLWRTILCSIWIV